MDEFLNWGAQLALGVCKCLTRRVNGGTCKPTQGASIGARGVPYYSACMLRFGPEGARAALLFRVVANDGPILARGKEASFQIAWDVPTKRPPPIEDALMGAGFEWTRTAAGYRLLQAVTPLAKLDGIEKGSQIDEETERAQIKAVSGWAEDLFRKADFV